MSRCWKARAIVCAKVKSKSPPGARKHERTGLHPSPSQSLSPTAEHASPLPPLRPVPGLQPLPTRLLTGAGPIRLTPGHRTPSAAQPGPTSSAPGPFSSLLPAGLGRNQSPTTPTWILAISGSQSPRRFAAPFYPAVRPSANRRVIKKPRFLMRANSKLACILQIRDCLEFVALLRSELAEDDQQLGGMPLLLQQSGTRQRILNHSLGFLWPSQ